MSIDHDANYGIGYEVSVVDESTLDYYEGNLHEYIYGNLEVGFKSFEVGSYMTGVIDGVYIVVDHDFNKGNDLTESKAALEHEINRMGLRPDGNFGLVGGVLVC